MGTRPTMPTRKIYDVGGSTVVSLPPSVQEATDITTGMTVIVEADDGAIRIAEAEVREAHRPDGDS